jgi:SAM-dependent methyltransferase
VKSFDKCILIDYPNFEFDKRNKYLELCGVYNIDVLLIIDSDEFVLENSNWDEFYYNLKARIFERDTGQRNVYAIMLQSANSSVFLAYPRVWYKPSDMTYYGGKHYLFRNKDLNISNFPHQADHSLNLIEGIILGHDHKLRSNEHNESRFAYQTWLVNYEACLSMYNPEEYWLEQGKTYRQRFIYNECFELQEKMFIDFLKTLQFETVVEVGAGFGRITKLMLENFPQIKEYLAIDLSPDQITELCNNISDNRLQSQVISIQDFKTEKKYDLVLAVEVLMFIPPAEIDNVYQRLLDLTKTHVVNVDWYEDVAVSGAEYNFIHQYRANRVKHIMKPGLDVRQSIFHYRKSSSILIGITKARDLKEFDDAVAKLSEFDKIWCCYYNPSIVAENLIRNYFLAAKEYTHLALLPDDLIVTKKDFDILIDDLSIGNYPVLCGICNVDMTEQGLKSLNVDVHNLQPRRRDHYGMRSYNWLIEGSTEHIELLNKPQPVRVMFAGWPLLIIRRDVVEKIKFKNDAEYGYPGGCCDDVIWCADCYDLGIPIYCDLRARMKHLKVDAWSLTNYMVGRKSPHTYLERADGRISNIF